MTGKSGPGYREYPEHRISTKPAGVRAQVRFNGEVIADSRDAVRLEETGHPVVYYFPRKDVKMDRLVRTDRTTYCPFKGHASYYSVSSSARTAENAVWSYEEPYEETSLIRERLAFYPDEVDSIMTEQP